MTTPSFALGFRRGRGVVRVVRFSFVGGLSTLVHLGLFAAFAAALTTQIANLLALVTATLVNTAANRYWTFGVSERVSMLTDHLRALAVFGVTWFASAAALWLVPHVVANPSNLLRTLAIGTAMASSTVARFAAMDRWIFAARGHV